ncbi:hypothetical protein [Paenibacillus sp. LHD-38]|uniref:hypothetical protein n=1 Tax=Paenibacillus sp. LHD-38 TaxID=3072143 RepID=UPI00280D86B9|nr:hypothetical protein [Paenibacillus sp. LHD-38]MDQ8737609.1 hypothetical protein [Paenibacillus sp. LHD-38]
MITIRRSLKQRFFLALTILIWIAAAVPSAFAEESDIDSQLDSYTIPDKSVPAAPIIVDTAVPDGSIGNPPTYEVGDTDPSTGQGGLPDSSGGSGQIPGYDSGGGSQGGSVDGKGDGPPKVGGIDGANPQSPEKPGSEGTPDGTNDPQGPQLPGTDGGSSSPGGSDPQTGEADGTGQTGTENTGTENTETSNTETSDTDEQSTKDPESKPWYEGFFNHVKQAATGALAGAIGAAIVIVVVVAVAAVLGVTIGVPLLIVAAAAGIIAGAVYALYAGDSFNFLKGIGIGGLAAVSVISIGQAGIAAAFRGGWQLLTNVGVRGALRAAGSRIATFAQGAFGAFRNGIAALARTPITTLKSAIVSKTFGFTVLLNMGTSVFSKLAFEGEMPGLQEGALMLAESVAGALIFDKIGDIIGKQALSKLGKRLSSFVASAFESMTINVLLKRENADPGSASQVGFFKAFILQPLLGFRLNRWRTNEQVGTALSDLEARGITVDSSNIGNKKMTNVQLDRLWSNGANPNSVRHWGQDGHQVTQNQYDRLLENQDKLTQMENKQEIFEKLTEKAIEEPVKDKFGLGK